MDFKPTLKAYYKATFHRNKSMIDGFRVFSEPSGYYIEKSSFTTEIIGCFIILILFFTPFYIYSLNFSDDKHMTGLFICILIVEILAFIFISPIIRYRFATFEHTDELEKNLQERKIEELSKGFKFFIINYIILIVIPFLIIWFRLLQVPNNTMPPSELVLCSGFGSCVTLIFEKFGKIKKLKKTEQAKQNTHRFFLYNIGCILLTVVFIGACYFAAYARPYDAWTKSSQANNMIQTIEKDGITRVSTFDYEENKNEIKTKVGTWYVFAKKTIDPNEMEAIGKNMNAMYRSDINEIINKNGSIAFHYDTRFFLFFNLGYYCYNPSGNALSSIKKEYPGYSIQTLQNGWYKLTN